MSRLVASTLLLTESLIHETLKCLYYIQGM